MTFIGCKSSKPNISKLRKSNLQTHLSSNRSESSFGTRLQTYPDGHQAFLFKHAANDKKAAVKKRISYQTMNLLQIVNSSKFVYGKKY